MSFDTVKTFWKTVVEEREDFWASLFKKVIMITVQVTLASVGLPFDNHFFF